MRAKRARKIVTNLMILTILFSGSAVLIDRNTNDGIVSNPHDLSYSFYFPLVTKNHPSKKGVGRGGSRCEPGNAVGASYARGWGVSIGDCQGVEDIPCIWGNGVATMVISGLLQIIGNSDYVLGFNEPDMFTQANMSPEESVEPWHALRMAYPDKKWVSPSTTISMGWLPEFYQRYITEYPDDNPPFDVIDFHCYLNTVDGCIERAGYFINMADSWGVDEVWLSEFAFYGPGDTERAAEFISWMNGQPRITRYFWFIDECRIGEPWCYWTWLAEYHSDPVVLTELGVMYRDTK